MLFSSLSETFCPFYTSSPNRCKMQTSEEAGCIHPRLSRTTCCINQGLQGTTCNTFSRLLSFVCALRDQGWPNVFQQHFLSCSLKVLLRALGMCLWHWPQLLNNSRRQSCSIYGLKSFPGCAFSQAECGYLLCGSY